MNIIIIRIINRNHADNWNNTNNDTQNIDYIPVFFSSLIKLIDLMNVMGIIVYFIRAQVMIIECFMK